MTFDKKVCKQCKELKSLEDFHLDKYGRKGRKSKCKDCNRAYREKSRDRLAEYRAGRRLEAAEYARHYRKINPEVGRRNSRKRRAIKRYVPHVALTNEQYKRLYEFRDQVFGEVTS